ncbi:MAG TPA: YraN family protein [Bacteroidales bacterium]|nr:YraN family protein [Bacteroidales bacterium]
MLNTKDIGDEAETLAVQHLVSEGYEILDRNWRFRHLELDIVARMGQFLIVVEVKSRAGNYVVEPQLAVNRSKQNLIISASNAYLLNKNLDLEVRFDIITVVFYRSNYQLEHIENAFYPKVR